jgi:hypothetical protein
MGAEQTPVGLAFSVRYPPKAEFQTVTPPPAALK